MKKLLSTTIVLILLTVATLLFAGVTRKPYLQILTSNSVSIRWQTDIYSIGKVYYGTSFDSLVFEKLESEDEKVEHEVLLSNLAPSTKYYYSVDGASNGSLEQYFVTAPEEGSKDSVRIWVIADFGQKSSLQNKRREETVAVWKEFNKNSYHADFVLSLGDQTEDDTRFQLQHNFFNQLEDVCKVSPIYTLEGNHDNHDNVALYFDTFTLPANGECGGTPSGTEDYYSFNYANIHVVVLSTEIKDFDGKQVEWLKKDLRANNQDWLIACMHRPMHSGGHHKSNTDVSAIKEKKYWLPILENYGIDLVLYGHNHIYERSYLTDNLTGSTENITAVNKIDTTLGREDVSGAYHKVKGKPHDGTIFIEVAAGGYASDKFTHYPIFPIYYHDKNTEGSLVIDVIDNKMNVKFLCTEPDSNGNHVWDYFSIIKN